MDRREFVGNLVGSTVALNLLSIENNNKENPKKLPVVQFDENGRISNYDEVLAKIPWGKYVDHYIRRKCHCWVPKADAFMGLWPKRRSTRIWGEVELMDTWFDDGFRHVIISILPESIICKTNLHEKNIFGNVRWQDQGVKVGVCHEP